MRAVRKGTSHDSLQIVDDEARMNLSRRCLRWFLKDLPETQLFADDEQREKAIRDLENSGPAWHAILHIIILISALLLFKKFVWYRLPIPPEIESWLFPIFPAFVIIAYSVYWQRQRAAVFFRNILLQDGVPVCMKCGYCLRGLSSDRCPECGKELDARVQALIRVEAQPDGGAPADGPASSRVRVG